MAAKWSINMPVIYQYYASSVWNSIRNFVFFVLFPPFFLQNVCLWQELRGRLFRIIRKLLSTFPKLLLQISLAIVTGWSAVNRVKEMVGGWRGNSFYSDPSTLASSNSSLPSSPFLVISLLLIGWIDSLVSLLIV